MSEAGEQRTIGLKVTNFGPIVEADIELRPLTVFVGPSNTGKSYLAILIYALHSLFAGYLDPSARLWRGERNRKIAVESADLLLQWAKTQPEDPYPDSPSNVGPLPPDVADLVREVIRSSGDLGSALPTGLARCFGVGRDIARLVRDGSGSGSRIVVRQRQAVGGRAQSPIEYEFSMRGGESQSHEFTLSVPPEVDLQLSDTTSALALALFAVRSLGRFAELDTPEGTSWVSQVITLLTESAIAHSAEPFSRSAYYLPASRTGVIQAQRTIVGATISRVSGPGIDDAPPLSGVIGDFLRELIGIDDEEHPATDDGDVLASALERDVLGGEIVVKRTEANYPTFFYRPAGLDRELPILTSSSMVSELAPVALYLRHYVRPGNTLIIEEPESHLHPAMQAEFALHLVRLVHAGIRVIVTTHSEWVLDQFANLVRLAGLSEAEREGLRGADAALSPDDVGFWLFKPNAKRRGSVVQELKVNPDEGGLLSGYDEVADEMYNMWAEIGNRIADRGAE